MRLRMKSSQSTSTEPKREGSVKRFVELCLRWRLLVFVGVALVVVIGVLALVAMVVIL